MSDGDGAVQLTHRVEVRLEFQKPLAPSNLFGHLVATGVPGVEEWRAGAYRVAVRLRRGAAIVEAGLPVDGAVPTVLWLQNTDDRDEAIIRTTRALDLDADPYAIALTLVDDPRLAPLVAAVPGRRVPGTLDPEQMALRAVLGQQISTAAARTHAGRLVQAFGTPIEDPSGGLTHLFPRPADLLTSIDDLASVARMPDTRRRTLLGMARALADGQVVLDRTGDHAAVRRALRGIPGVGPWIVETIMMRAMGDADAFLSGDLGARQAAVRLGLPDRGPALERASRAWSPYRAYALQYLWATGAHAVNVLPA